MAGEFLRSKGIDIDAEMSRIQYGASTPHSSSDSTCFTNVLIPQTRSDSRWDVCIDNNKIASIQPHNPSEPRQSQIHGHGALLARSLCHPHVHIDKAYLLSHPKYSHLRIETGDFKEAMSLTTSAKEDFTHEDLLERGQRVIDESAAAGVTHMRAFVEVDSVVGTKCLNAGIEMKRSAEGDGKCIVQICAFAQMPLFSGMDGDPGGEMIRELMKEAASRAEVDVLGSTPYVEHDREKQQKNIDWLIDLCIENGKHLDFHLDYHLEPDTEPMVWYVVQCLKAKAWLQKVKDRTIVLGHCTRLTLFPDDEWKRLKDEIGDLPISFVGLPTSDLFMMRTPDRIRGTLDVPKIIKDYGLNACIGINNIGNAFTPYGSCDPLTLACNGVGVYQAGTQQDAELLYECVSTRARSAIGMGGRKQESSGDGESLGLQEGDEASLLLFGSEKEEWRTRRSVVEAVYLYDHSQGRTAFLLGKATSGL